jgi:DNA polymerase
VQDYCHIDIETYSEAPLKKTGVYKYAEHPSTEVLVVCYRFGHTGPVHTWIPQKSIPPSAKPLKSAMDKGSELYVQEYIPPDLFEWITSGRQLRAWNAMFERVVLGTLGRTGRLDWPEIAREQWGCTMAKAAAASLRQALGLCAKDCETHPKDESGKVAMLQLCKPKRPSKKNPDTRWMVGAYPEKFRMLYHYCMDDVRAESALDKYIPELDRKERSAYLLDQKINDAGIMVDLDSVRSAQVLINEYRERLVHSCYQMTGVRPSQTGALAEYIRTKEGFKIEDLQKATVVELLKDPETPRRVAKLLKIYMFHNMKAVSKYAAMEAAVCEDGRLRGMFRYHSASTGRWSSVIVQLQNLYRSCISDEHDPGANEAFAIGAMQFEDFDYFQGLFDKNPMAVLASCVRGMLLGGPGKLLLAVDYASIEARIVAWLAGNSELLEIFETTGLVYEYAASQIYDKPIEEITKGQRFIGKVATLALGYQGGKVAFAKMAHQYGVEIEDELAQQVVTDWRDANKSVVDLWGRLENAAADAIGNPGKSYSVAKRVKFRVRDDWLYMRIPSGRRLAYYKPKLSPGGKVTFMGIDTYSRQWKRCDTYGGKLFENAVQAIARDLLVTAMHRLNNEGLSIVGTVHDEVILEVDPEVELDYVADIMCKAPAWAEGLPVAVDGFKEKRYRK